MKKLTFNIILHLIPLWLFTAPAGAWADMQHPTVVACERALVQVNKSGEATGIELEVDVRDQDLKTLTTTDGTLGSFISSYPAKVFLSFGALDPALEWASIDFKLQRQLITAAVKYNIKKFGEHSTSIRGLRPINSIFRDVHNRSQHDATQFHGMELLLESPAAAGTAVVDAIKLAQDQGYVLRSTQAHIPFNLETILQNYDPHLAPALIAELFRQLNLYAEMTSVLHGYAINEVTSLRNGVQSLLFSFLTREKFIEVEKYLVDLIQNNPTEGADMKMCYVGFRAKGKYRNKNLVGFEFRAITPGALFKNTIGVLNSVSEQMRNGRLSIEPARLQRWLAQQKIYGKTHAQAWYNPGAVNRNIVNDAPPEVRAMIAADQQETILSEVFVEAEKNGAVLMLLHDWSQDPMLFENPAGQKFVLSQQLKGLRRIGTDPIHLILKDFIIESKLLSQIYKNLLTST